MNKQEIEIAKLFEGGILSVSNSNQIGVYN